MAPPRHRSRPLLSWLLPWRGTAAAAAAAVVLRPVRDRQVYTSVSGPQVIEHGQQLRAAVCPVCGLIASDQAVRLVQTATMRLHSDGKGDLMCWAFLVHDHHWPLTAEERDLVASWTTGQRLMQGYSR